MICWRQPSTKFYQDWARFCQQDSNFGQYINMLKYVRVTCMHDTRPPLGRARQITFILVIPYERALKRWPFYMKDVKSARLLNANYQYIDP